MNSQQNPKKKPPRNSEEPSGKGTPTIIDVDAGTLLLIIGLAIALPLFLTGLFAS
jgi:hypothetical protein